MTYPPPGGTPDPYQPQQPYGQQPYGQPADPSAPPSYPYSADPYGTPPGSPVGKYGDPPPASGQPYSGQPYPGQPYAQGYPPAYPAVPGTNVMAILSLVFAFVFSPVAIVLGHMAKKQIRQTGEQGDGLATAGLIIGYIFTGLTVLFCCGYLVVVIGALSSSAAAS